MDAPVAESSIGNSYEAPRTRRRAAVQTSIKKVLEPEPSQSTIQELSNATRKRSRVQKRKGEILTEPEAAKRLTLPDLKGEGGRRRGREGEKPTPQRFFLERDKISK